MEKMLEIACKQNPITGIECKCCKKIHEAETRVLFQASPYIFVCSNCNASNECDPTPLKKRILTYLKKLDVK